MHKDRQILSTLGWVTLVALHGCLGLGGQPASASQRTPSQTVLRIARSTDGMTFAETGETLISRAAAPDLVALPNQTILAYFDFAGVAGSDQTILAVARSDDAGRSWSAARPIYLRAPRGHAERARHPDAILQRNGSIRLYFACDLGRGGHARHSDHTLIRSATSRNGFDFRLDKLTRIRPNGGSDVHPLAVSIGSRVHLFTVRPNAAHAGSDAVQHFVSRDARRFARITVPEMPCDAYTGCVVNLRKGIRAYVASDDAGIRSFVSHTGRTWSIEPGTRLAHGWDPAVARLSDNTFLMVYSAAADDAAPDSSDLVVADFDPLTIDDFDWNTLDQDWPDLHGDLAALDPDEVEPIDAEPLTDTDAGEDVDATDHTVVADAADDEPAEVQGGEAVDADHVVSIDSEAAADFPQIGTGLEDWNPADTNGFAPLPHFRSKIDYFEWFKEYVLGKPLDNAYDYYMEFMPGPDDIPGTKPPWPEEFHDMFSDAYDGPPIPWDAESHPDWEATNQAIADLLERFREATTHSDYASPAKTSIDASLPDGDKLLIGILLPSLSSHRRMVKSTLADGWRKVDGRVSSERMLDAWRTSLRAASHMNQGATLIEDLVGTAERNQVQKTARWALKHDVFSDGELQTALDTLREFDRHDWDPTEMTRGEHGFAMDITQWMFSPPTPDGEPKINTKRAQALAAQDWFGDGTQMEFDSLTADDAYASIDAFDRYYRELVDQMRVGYPDVRTADVETTTQKYISATPLTNTFLPSLSRVYKLKTRLETSRRATQLVYATRLFKARNGRWPESLDELPAGPGDDVRIDPFTGDYFGYRVTDDGPTIYSASENGIDDGGIHSPRWDDEINNDAGSDDHVFWPPQPR